jgi:heme/copper-type cytochrome/quinol oxidase subunit 2
MSEQRATHAAATQQAAADEKAQHPALSALAFILLFVFAFVLVFVAAFVFVALTQQMGEERASDAAAAQHPARDQKAQDLAMIFVFALVLIAAFVLVLVLAFRLAALPHKVRKKQTADAAATQQTTGDQELQQAMLLIAALGAVSASFVVFLSATALAQQPRKKQASRPLAARDTAPDHHFLKV